MSELDAERHERRPELDFTTDDPWERQLARDYWLIGADGRFVYRPGDLERGAYDQRPALRNQRSGIAYYLRKLVRAYIPAASCPQCQARVYVDNRRDYADILKKLETGKIEMCSDCRALAADEAQRALASRRWREDHGWYDEHPVVTVSTLPLRSAVSLLAILRRPYDTAYTSTMPLQRWSRILPAYAATETDAHARLRELVAAKSLFPHPDTPSSGYRAVHSRTQQVSLDFRHARLTAPGPGPTGPRNEGLVAELITALTGTWPDHWRHQQAAECRRILHEETTGYLIRILHKHNLPAPRNNRERDVIQTMVDTLTLGQSMCLINAAAQRAYEQFQGRQVVNVREASNRVLDLLQWRVVQIINGEADAATLITSPPPCSEVTSAFFCTALQRTSVLHERAEPLDPPPV